MSIFSRRLHSARLAPPAVYTATFYLDPTSSSSTSSGTQSSPWKTAADLNNNAASLIPGSVLYVKRGAVINGKIFLTASGIADQPILITPYGVGAQPRFTGSDDVNLTLGTPSSTTQGSYYVVNDCEFDNGNWAGIRTYGNNNIIQNCTLKNSVAGCHVEGTHTKITNCVITNNNRMSVNTPTNVNNNDDSGAFGILLGSGGSFSEVSYCTISGHLATSYDYGYDGCAVEISGAANCYVHHNTAFNNETFCELGNSSSMDNRIMYNLIYDSFVNAKALVTRGGSGDVFGPVLRTTFDYNSVYFTGANASAIIAYSNAGQNVLSINHNAIKVPNYSLQTDGPVTETNNVFGGPVSMAQTLNSTSILTDPLFVSTTDLHLQPGSAGYSRNAGAYVN